MNKEPEEINDKEESYIERIKNTVSTEDIPVEFVEVVNDNFWDLF